MDHAACLFLQHFLLQDMGTGDGIVISLQERSAAR
jgi:hypothetical protein